MVQQYIHPQYIHPQHTTLLHKQFTLKFKKTTIYIAAILFRIIGEQCWYNDKTCDIFSIAPSLPDNIGTIMIIVKYSIELTVKQ